MWNIVIAIVIGSIGSVSLAGILLFLKDEILTKVASYLLSLAGGTLLGAAFLISNSFGWFVAFSVVAHEIPQELSDFGILLKNGYSRKKALWYNLLSGSTAIPGGILAYYAMETMNSTLPIVLSLSAASFIYIALADLVPQMHNKTKKKIQ